MYAKKKNCFLPVLTIALFIGVLLALAPHTARAQVSLPDLLMDWPKETGIENNAAGITIHWTQVPGATNYDVFRYEDGDGGDSVYVSLDSSKTSFTDTNVTPGKVYAYYMCVCNRQTGASSHCWMVGATARLLPPKSLTVSPSGNFAAFCWEKSTGAGYYNIEVSKNSAFSSPDSYLVTAGAASANITGLVYGKTYYARIRACDECKSDHSSWSDPVKFTTLKKSSKISVKALNYSGSKTSLQKMWTVGFSPTCTEFLKLIRENKNGASMTFPNAASYKETLRYYYLLTGDGNVSSRNIATPNSLTFEIKKNAANKAYATGKKGYLRYYKKAYTMLNKAGVRSGMSKYKAAQKIDTYIRRITKYDKTLKNQNFYDIIDHKKGVCRAYAQLFQVMCLQAGIDCRYCAGTYKNGGHAWNRFKANGKWYYIDVTFRDTAGTKAWPISRRKLKKHRAKGTLKFTDAYGYYHIGPHSYVI